MDGKEMNYELLDAFNKAAEDKDLDQLQEVIMLMLTIYGVKTNEVAQLLLSIMRNVLCQEHNIKLLADGGINASELNVEQVLALQEVLATV